MNFMQFKIESLNEIAAVAAKFVDFIENHFQQKGISEKCVAFYGSMGVGKTTFITEVCRRMGVNDNISSPTFSIINEYKTDNGGLIFHFDMYRIESEIEAYDFGYEDYFYSGNFCFIEWPEKICNILPDSTLKVKIEENIDSSRNISLLDVQ